MLSILDKKGYVTRAKEGRKHFYKATVSQEDSQRSTLNELLERVFGGSSVKLAETLLNSEKVSSNDMEKIKSMIEEKQTEKAAE